MNISDILTAFGPDERVTYDNLALRLSLPTGRGAASRFAHKLRKFNIRPKTTRFGQTIHNAYHREQFEQVQRTKRAYTEYTVALDV